MSLKSIPSTPTTPISDYENLPAHSAARNEPETNAEPAHEEPVHSEGQKNYAALLHSRNPPSHHQFVHRRALESAEDFYETGEPPEIPSRRYHPSEVTPIEPKVIDELKDACEQLNATVRKLIQDFAAVRPDERKGFLKLRNDPAASGAARTELLKGLFSKDFRVCASRVTSARHAVDLKVAPEADRGRAERVLGSMAAEFTRNAIDALDDKQLKVLKRHLGIPAELQSQIVEMSHKVNSYSASTARDMVIEQLIKQVAPARRKIT